MKYHEILTKEFLTEEYCNKKRSPHNIAKQIGCDPHTIYRYLQKLDIQQETRDGRIEACQKFNRLTTVKVVGSSKNRTYIWECVCDCGNIAKVRTSQLKNNSIKSCGCAVEKGKANKRWTGCEDISGNFWSGVKIGAKNRNISFDLKIEDVWGLYLRQNKKCYLSGLDIDFIMYKETASVDRIDSVKPYTLDNIALCHKDINKIKASFSVNEFLYFCRLVSDFDGELISISDSPSVYRGYWKDLQYNANRRKIDFQITIDDINRIFRRQGGECALTGLRLTVPTNLQEYRSRAHTFSVDRVDNNIGYTSENIQVVHKLINQSRKDLTIERYKELCQKVQKWNKD